MFGFGKSKKKNEPENKKGISNFAQQIMNMLGCPCKHFPKGSDPAKVMNAYDDAFAKREQSGYTPLIIAVDNTLLEVVEEIAKTPEELNGRTKWARDGMKRSASSNANPATFQSAFPDL